MDVIYPGFLDQHPDIVQNTKYALANYVKGLAGSLAGDSIGNNHDPDVILHPHLQIRTDADGWPILRQTAWADLRKQDLEKIVRHYLQKQYSKMNHIFVGT